MSIDIHCPQCEKLIRAPDNAGGKYGKCPYCETKVYIPALTDDDGEIGLAPIDEAEERREQELIRESVRYAAAFDKESDKLPPEGSASRGGGGRSVQEPPPGEVIDIGELVEAYVVAMRDSKLNDAERVIKKLKSAGVRAADYVEGLMLDPAPPPLGNVPKPLMMGFLKSLLGRLN